MENTQKAQGVISAICETLRVTKEGIMSRSRGERLVMARRIFCMITKKSTDLSLTAIGLHIMRSHSNVIYLIKTGECYEKHWKPFAELVQQCRESINPDNENPR